MISKVLQADSFYHTARYIVQKPGMEVIHVEGVRQHDVTLMAADFETQAALRPEKAHACFHAILSFYPGEKLSDEKILEIAERYLKELKITETQIAITKHTDKAHLHLHIMANMVNNKGKSISSSWIGLRGKKIAQALTQEYKLTPALEKNLELTNLTALNEMQATKYKIYMAISENLPRSTSMNDLEKRLQESGIGVQYKFKSQTDEKQGISFKMGDYSFKGSTVDRKFSLNGLQQSLTMNQKETLVLSGLQLQKQFRLQKTISVTKSRHPSPANKYTGGSETARAAPEERQYKSAIKATKGVLTALTEPIQQVDPIPRELQPEKKQKKKKRHDQGLSL